jgi:hypothetical protein
LKHIRAQIAALLAELTIAIRRGFGGRVSGTAIDEPQNKG